MLSTILDMDCSRKVSSIQTQRLPDLIELKHIRQSGAGHWGIKASVLGELLARGFPIPDGFCLSIPAYRESGADFKISPLLKSALRSASDHLFLSSEFLAVRSSAAAEDLPGVSYAGIYQSVIGIAKPEDIGKAVQTVWKSYVNPFATAVRVNNHQENASGGMGVLIQPVIHAEVAGVCFSVDPVRPRSGRMVINASWGLGAGVVEGSIPTDTFWLQRDNLAVVDQQIVEKDSCFMLDHKEGLVHSRVPETKQHIVSLPTDWARRIAQFTMAAEQVFARPQDVEWAIANGRVWILQSRPITSLTDEIIKKYVFPVDWENPEQAQRLWKRTRYEHQGNSPLLPLDVDYVRLMESIRVETCLSIGADRNEDLWVVNGQIFSSPAPMPVSEADLRVRRQAFRDLQERLIDAGLTAWDHWGSEIERANARLVTVDVSNLDAAGLANFLEEAMAVRTRHNMLHPMMWFKPRQPYFEAFQAISGLSGMEAESAAYRLLEGEESPLTRLIDGIYNLAMEAHDLPAVVEWIHQVIKNPIAQTVDEYPGFPKTAPGAADWLSRFKAFLSAYGDRNGQGYGSEALISTPTWRDQPIQVIRMIENFLDESVEPPWKQREQSRQVIEAEIAEWCASCPDPQMVEDFLQQLRIAQRTQPVIEIHNHHIEQVSLGQLHRAVLAGSSWLHSRGVLSGTDDIFWLTFSEILGVLRNSQREPLVEVIQKRKIAHHEWAKYIPPPYLGLPPAGLSPRPVDQDTPPVGQSPVSDQIRGIGASVGVVSGSARVIETWQPAPQIKPGDILVAENAGPLWLPFFPILAGIVLEVGSLGQHAATTAREYGIPAVLSAANATRLIKDGDWITIDGLEGTVKLKAVE